MKKRVWLLLALLGILILGGITYHQFLWKPDPQTLLTHSLEKLNQEASFRYSMLQHQWVDGKNRTVTQILGEKDGGNTRISGQLIGTDIEMILAGEGFFIRDPFTKHWVRYPNGPEAQAVFLAELDPKAALQFKELGEVMLSGREKLNERKMWVVQFQPSVQNQIMEQNWSDFSYIVWISEKEKEIAKVIIEARNKLNDQKTTITIEFKDYGKKLAIEAPKI